MDVVDATNDFLDWELLQTNSDSESAIDSANSLDGIDSGGLIQANYFSLESKDRRAERVDDDVSDKSDNPSWIDPGFDDGPTRYLNKESGEFWSDSGSERSDDRKIGELEVLKEVYSPENEVKFEGIGEIHEGEEDLEKIRMDSTGSDVCSPKISDSVENSQVNVEVNANSDVESEVLGHENGKILSDVNRRNGELEKRGIVWWKMPMEFLKYCVLRMSPVWTVSVAAAFMGFLILGRRLYKMKKKARGLEIKVTVDDKKVSQVMSRAARLNEAFSVVKRVPVIRPSLPAVGSNSTWPAMSMR